MNALARNIALVAIALVALATAYLVSRSGTGKDAAVSELYALSLPDPAGKTQTLKQWQGKVLVVNFWATWCPPCLKEMPGFSRLQRQYADKGVQFVGIGIDSPGKIQEFANSTPVSYPLLMGASDTFAVARKLGNYSDALPFTVILAQDGRLRGTRLGLWNEAELGKLLLDLTR